MGPPAGVGAPPAAKPQPKETTAESAAQQKKCPECGQTGGKHLATCWYSLHPEDLES
jgi:hypothetical protein